MKLSKKLFTGLLVVLLMIPSIISAKADGNENIIKGLSYTSTTGVGIEYSYDLMSGESKQSTSRLTDGVKASTAEYGDSGWVHFYRGYTRELVFELPSEKAVTGFSMGILQAEEGGVWLPSYIKLAVSQNGTDYMTVCDFDNVSYHGYAAKRIIHAEANAEDVCAAKFVKITFSIDVSVYIDEIEVFGHDVSGNEHAIVRDAEKSYANAYNTGVPGCRDMVLLYCGYPGVYGDSYVQNTEEEMLYYCGYVSKDGEVKDTMFDSVMFSALGSVFPSGYRSDDSQSSVALMSDWQYFIDSIFDTEYNCGALERALNTVKAKLGNDDYTMKIVINMPFPHISSLPFGDIDGDGVNDFCRNSDDQLKLFAWFMDAVVAKMNERGYKNLELGGFYWGGESLPSNKGEKLINLVKKTSELIHERNCGFFWIPFLYGNGFDITSELGFDSVQMQPNYSFLEKAQAKMLLEANDAIYKFGLGMEIEINWNADTDAVCRDKYYAYLNAGAATGYMANASHSYYQNSNPGTYYHAAKSENSVYRKIYDDTYAFIKHTYVCEAPTLEGGDKTVESGKKQRGTVLTGALTAGMGEFVVAEDVKHGILSLNEANGTYVYVPEDGYSGSDSFSIEYIGDFVHADAVTVNITVTGSGTESSADVSAESDVSTPSSEASESENNADNGTLWKVLAAAAAAIIIGVGTFIFFKMRRNRATPK